MTYRNFDFSTFIHTIHTASWYEAGMIACLALAALVSWRRTASTGAVDGKSVFASLLVAAAAALGVVFKLTRALDVVVLLYLALLFFSVADIYVCSRIRARLADAIETERIQERRRSLMGRSGDGEGRRSHHRRHHHESGGSEGGSHSHSHSHGRHGHGERRHGSDEFPDAKAPEFDDPLAEDK